MDLVVMSHHHHAASLESEAQLLERLLDGGAIAVRRLLQLTQLEGAVGAEEDGFHGGGDFSHRLVPWPRRGSGQIVPSDARSPATAAAARAPRRRGRRLRGGLQT